MNIINIFLPHLPYFYHNFPIYLPFTRTHTHTTTHPPPNNPLNIQKKNLYDEKQFIDHKIYKYFGGDNYNVIECSTHNIYISTDRYIYNKRNNANIFYAHNYKKKSNKRENNRRVLPFLFHYRPTVYTHILYKYR